MDIQKLEKFEDWFATRYPNVQKTIDLHNNHESIVFRNNQAEAWQAAKAQAIPEGFVVVPKEPTQKMLNAGHVVMNPIKGSLVQAGTNQKRRDCYKAMIEAAQEQANESE